MGGRPAGLALGDQHRREDRPAGLPHGGVRREAPQDPVPLEERQQAQRPGDQPADEDGPVDQVPDPPGPCGGPPGTPRRGPAAELARQQGLHRHRDQLADLGGGEPQLEGEVVGRGVDGAEQRLARGDDTGPGESSDGRGGSEGAAAFGGLTACRAQTEYGSTFPSVRRNTYEPARAYSRSVPPISRHLPRTFTPTRRCRLRSSGTSAAYCARAVPAAAPLAPNPNVKMKSGSRTAFRAVKAIEYLRGVLVSPRPRKTPLATSQSVAAGVPRARTRR